MCVIWRTHRGSYKLSLVPSRCSPELREILDLNIFSVIHTHIHHPHTLLYFTCDLLCTGQLKRDCFHDHHLRDDIEQSCKSLIPAAVSHVTIT